MSVVLVTGAIGGIGSAIASELRAGGHEVVTQDLRATESSTPDIVGDLLDPAVMAELVALCERRGVDAVVGAHGIAAAEALAATSRELSDRAMLVNTLSFIELFDAIEERLTGAGGSFTAISSQAGLLGEANNGPYCASKFGLVGWAQERSRSTGVRLRILCPGPTETPLLRDAFQGMADAQGITYDDVLASRTANIPGGRLSTTAEMGRTARFLVEVEQPRLIIAPVTGGEVLY